LLCVLLASETIWSVHAANTVRAHAHARRSRRQPPTNNTPVGAADCGEPNSSTYFDTKWNDEAIASIRSKPEEKDFKAEDYMRCTSGAASTRRWGLTRASSSSGCEKPVHCRCHDDKCEKELPATGVHANDRSWAGSDVSYSYQKGPALMGFTKDTRVAAAKKLGQRLSPGAFKFDPAATDKKFQSVNNWCPCKNLQWIVCAARGLLPDQGGPVFKLVTASADIRRGHVVAQEICILSKMCGNWKWEWPANTDFKCQLKPNVEIM